MDGRRCNKALCTKASSRFIYNGFYRPPTFAKRWVSVKQRRPIMRVKSRKTGINYLCDTIILPQYYSFERDAKNKTDFENFKKISFDCWNIFISAYFVCALQIPLSSMKSRAYNKLMKNTIDYFKEQYPLFPKVLKTFLRPKIQSVWKWEHYW